MKPQNPISNHPFLLLLRKCKNPKTFKLVHAHMITTGLALHTYPLSQILLTSTQPPLFSTLGLSYAIAIFNHITRPTTFLCNTLISSLVANKQTQTALSFYTQILTSQTLIPNNFTYPSLFKACGSHPWFAHGRALHAHVLKFLEPACDHFVRTSLVNFYSKCGKLALSRYLFNQINQPDLATWNSIIAAHASTTSIEALILFNEMQLALVRPNEVTLVALICACANLGTLGQGAWAHAYAERSSFLNLNLIVGTALIDMYARCGRIDLAHQVFDTLPNRDTLCYNVMIGGLAIHGHGQRAVELFDRMRCEGVMVDDVTLVVVMCACAHVGLVDEGRQCFESMEDVYGIEPKIEHYGCMVDILGRAGEFEEAEGIVRRMPMKPNAVLWRSLLGACRTHDNLELGEHALTHLMQLEPENSGNYVLLSNIYAHVNRWDDVRRIREVMKDMGVSKVPGCSLIEMDGV